MEKKIINTPEAPAAIGPYSQAVVAGGVMYMSGQIALDPESGEMLEGDVEAQTEQVIKNMSAVLNAYGLGFEHLVRTTIFLVDMDDFSKVNAIYGEQFDEAPPARATVAVAQLPRGAKVEIDGIAVVPPEA